MLRMVSTSLCLVVALAAAEPCPDRAAILARMELVAGWQLAHPRHPPRHWANAAFYAGLVELARIAPPGASYRDTLIALAAAEEWRPGPRPFHADDHAVCQLYLALAEEAGDPSLLAPTRAAMDAVIAADHRTPLDFTVANQVRWNWCDALFMAPPVLARLARLSGDRRYLDFLDREWWATHAALFDPEAGLFLRDSRFRRSAGRATFWGRGNGWVIAGLVRVLAELPADHPTRGDYVALLRDMRAALLPLQRDDGFWRADLRDPAPDDKGESSATAFIGYGLCAGVNQGELDPATTLPAVVRAWRALASATDEHGRLGLVQAIGDRPRAVAADSWETYASGAWLLLLAELHRCDPGALETAWDAVLAGTAPPAGAP